jgi:hypothetical protein
MEDFSAGHISTQERLLIEEIDSKLGSDRFRISGVTPPHGMERRRNRISARRRMIFRTRAFRITVREATAMKP